MLEPPDSIPNSEVKRHIADGSVGLPHVRVGHRQVYIKKPVANATGFFIGKNRIKMTRKIARQDSIRV